MDLQGDVELAAFLRSLEEQGMAKRAPGKTWVFTALRADTDSAEGHTEGIGVHWLELERCAVGTDGLHAGGAAPDPRAQRGADGAEPLAGVVSAVNETLGYGLEPDDFAL